MTRYSGACSLKNNITMTSLRPIREDLSMEDSLSFESSDDDNDIEEENVPDTPSVTNRPDGISLPLQSNGEILNTENFENDLDSNQLKVPSDYILEGDKTSNIQDHIALMDRSSLNRDDQDVENGNNSHLQFERSIREEEELLREANKTKMAFLAYRNALMHLIHNQDRSCEKKQISSDKNETKEDDNADERITQLEHQARTIVENKSKTCFDAIHIAKEWSLRHEKRKSLSNMTKKSLQEEMIRRRNLKKKGQKTLKGSQPSNKSSQREMIDKNQTPSYVRLRKKPCKHPECMFDKYFAIQYNGMKRDDDSNGKENKEGEEKRAARYRTTNWIGEIAKWRMHRRRSIVDSCKQCGCIDCRNKLKELKS